MKFSQDDFGVVVVVVVVSGTVKEGLFVVSKMGLFVVNSEFVFDSGVVSSCSKFRISDTVSKSSKFVVGKSSISKEVVTKKSSSFSVSVVKLNIFVEEFC